MSYEPTTTCNLSCPECPSGLKVFTRPEGSAELSLYTNTLDQVKDHLIFIYLYFQGEPFLHKNFLEMIRLSKLRNLFTITSTNGHFLTKSNSERIVESGLDRLIISVDGATEASYLQYRIGGSFQKVLDGTRNLVEAKKKKKSHHPFIVLQMIVFASNQNQIEEVKRMGKELGVDQVLFKTAQIYDYKQGNALIPTINKYSRYYETKKGQWEIKNPLDNKCWKQWHSMVVTWDGDVIPCCFDKDAKHKMGSLTDHTLPNIWLDQTYQNFRTAITTSRKSIDICKNCSEGMTVWQTT